MSNNFFNESPLALKYGEKIILHHKQMIFKLTTFLYLFKDKQYFEIQTWLNVFIFKAQPQCTDTHAYNGCLFQRDK